MVVLIVVILCYKIRFITISIVGIEPDAILFRDGEMLVWDGHDCSFAVGQVCIVLITVFLDGISRVALIR